MTVKKYTDLLDLKDDVALNKGKVIRTMNGEIEFKNVTYSYTGEKTIIDDLSLKIKSEHIII